MGTPPNVMGLNEKQIRRFFGKVEKVENGCWLWTGQKGVRNYGRLEINKVTYYSHRVSYQYFKGEIPTNYQIDHLCRVHNCVNPGHLEAVTQKVNILRGIGVTAINATKTHCPKGHPYTEDNTIFGPQYKKNGFNRQCKICKRERDRVIDARRRLLKRQKVG